MIRNQRGLTLTELLLTLTILSFAGILIWSVFIQGFKYSETAEAKNRLHQEANILITNLTNIHQTAEYYKIWNTTECEISVDITNSKESATVQTKVYRDSELCYDVKSASETPISIDTPEKTVINHDPFFKDLEIQVIVSQKNNKSINATVDTVLYRIKDGGT